MFHTIITAVAVGFAPAPAPETSDEELKKIQGTWVVVKMAWQREPFKPDRVSVTVDRDNLAFHTQNGVSRYKIKRIRSGEIDLIKQTAPVVGELHVGIYALEGDKLKICFAVDGPLGMDDPPNRPNKYESPDGSRYIVYFLERQKTEKDEKKKTKP